METFYVIMIIIWTLAFIFTMLANDEKLFKPQFIITWFVLMVQFIGNCFGC